MGVNNLWNLINKVGITNINCQKLFKIIRKVKNINSNGNVEKLDYIVLSIDLSIWIYEAQLASGLNSLKSPHIRLIYNRLLHVLIKLNNCPIRFIGILDGIPPNMKNKYKQDKNHKLQHHFSHKNWGKICEEVKELLFLMGISCIYATGEAEATCAQLNKYGICDGCITMDGDAFLFGANVIIKNFTTQIQAPPKNLRKNGNNNNNTNNITPTRTNKASISSYPIPHRNYNRNSNNIINQNKIRTMELYYMNDIKNKLNIDRYKLIALGIIYGSDYSPGINNIGKIKGIKLLKPFSGINCLRVIKNLYNLSKNYCNANSSNNNNKNDENDINCDKNTVIFSSRDDNNSKGDHLTSFDNNNDSNNNKNIIITDDIDEYLQYNNNNDNNNTKYILKKLPKLSHSIASKKCKDYQINIIKYKRRKFIDTVIKRLYEQNNNSNHNNNQILSLNNINNLINEYINPKCDINKAINQIKSIVYVPPLYDNYAYNQNNNNNSEIWSKKKNIDINNNENILKIVNFKDSPVPFWSQPNIVKLNIFLKNKLLSDNTNQNVNTLSASSPAKDYSLSSYNNVWSNYAQNNNNIQINKTSFLPYMFKLRHLQATWDLLAYIENEKYKLNIDEEHVHANNNASNNNLISNGLYINNNNNLFFYPTKIISINKNYCNIHHCKNNCYILEWSCTKQNLNTINNNNNSSSGNEINPILLNPINNTLNRFNNNSNNNNSNGNESSNNHNTNNKQPCFLANIINKYFPNFISEYKKKQKQNNILEDNNRKRQLFSKGYRSPNKKIKKGANKQYAFLSPKKSRLKKLSNFSSKNITPSTSTIKITPVKKRKTYAFSTPVKKKKKIKLVTGQLKLDTMFFKNPLSGKCKKASTTNNITCNNINTSNAHSTVNFF